MKIKAFSILESVFGLVIIALILKIIATIFTFFIHQLEMIKNQNNWNFENEKLHYFINKSNHENESLIYNDSSWIWIDNYKRDTTRIVFRDSCVVLKKMRNNDSLSLNIPVKYCDTIINNNRKGYVRMNIISTNEDDTIKMRFYKSILPYEDINKLSFKIKNGN